jgi:FMN-dependent oxidoreductase (nitrilotriacetate monooxygenase family)
MRMADRKLVIGLLTGVEGSHPAAWLRPDAERGDHLRFESWARLVQTAERGLFDFFFLADAPGIRPGRMENLRRMSGIGELEPITLLSGLAAVTKHIGLAATASSSFYEPYNLARLFGSLDHVSHGRAAWNIVTSTIPSLNPNFGRDKPEDHPVRYRRAREFLKVALGLWDSWEDDAFTRDAEKAEFFDPAKLHPLNHKGEFYAVAGPLNVPRPPQGHPVIIQAGGSDAGREMAAETAEVVFTIGSTFETAKAFRDDLHQRMACYGRSPDQIRVIPSLTTLTDRTEAEANRRFRALQDGMHPGIGLEVLSFDIGNADLSQLPLDEPLPASLLPENTNRGKTYLAAVRELAGKGNPTLRQMYEQYAPGWGGLYTVGTAQQLADMMEEWFRGGAADGFMLSPMTVPTDLDAFIDLVVPELQRRGLFRTSYEGKTLRENLGLKRPVNRYSPASQG